MEKSVVIEQIREVIQVETKFSVIQESAVKLEPNQSKSLINLKTEEEFLKTQLEKLKKENFSLKSLTSAWKTTYEKKQNELAQAETKLQNKIYNEIWSEREEFCERAEKFDNQYGMASERWKKRVDEVFNPLPKRSNQKYQEKVEGLEMTIEEVQEKVGVLEKEDKPTEIFNVETQEADKFILNRNEASKEPSPEQGNGSENRSPAQESEITKPSAVCNQLGTVELNEAPEKLQSSEGQTNEETSKSTISDNNTERPNKKKVRFSKENDNCKIFYEYPGTLKIKFFSLVDKETVRKANRLKKKWK